MNNARPEEVLILNIIAQGIEDYLRGKSAKTKIKEELKPFLEAIDLNVEYIWRGVEEMRRRKFFPLRSRMISLLIDLSNRGENE
jgi:hypothetical protein